MSPSDADEREARVDAAIADYLQSVDEGRSVPITEFLAQHADIAAELREFFADHAALRGITASMMALPLTDSLPRVFGDFELLRVIGRGGMGTVYAAQRRAVQSISTSSISSRSRETSDGSNGTPNSHEFGYGSLQSHADALIAIKVLHPWLMLDARSRERFEREALTSLSLRHPHIVATLGSGLIGESQYLVMELVDGDSLDRALERGLDQQFVSHLLSQLANVAEALQHAHVHGVLHRDVKPSNLLLTHDGRLLIGDFGLARLAEQPSLTRSGEAVGSPTYMSPEQIASRNEVAPVDHRTDIYSLGATLYEVLTGRPPFVAESREQLLASIRNDEPLALRALNESVSADCEAVCLKALSKAPSDRFATAAEFAAELRRCADGTRSRTRPVGTVRRRMRRLRKLLQSKTAAVVVVTLALVVSVSWQWQQRTQQLARQQAFDAALVVALTGDLNATEAAIERAVQASVSTTDLELLRGQVAYHRGDYDNAIAHLSAYSTGRQARVATTALLASAQLGAGQWEDYESLLEQAESQPAASAEDFLFRGQAEIYLAPEKAVASLDAAVRQRDTPLARLVRAEARWNLAFDRSDLDVAAQALSDAFIARDMLPDHPAALMESLHAHSVAAVLFGEAGRSDDSQREWQQAERDFESLDRFQNLSQVLHNQVLHLIATNRHDEAFRRLQQATARHDDPLMTYDFAFALLRRGDLEAARKLLEQRSRTLTSNEVFMLCWLQHMTGDSNAASATYAQISSKYQSGLTALFVPSLLLARGEVESARAASRHLQATTKPPRLRAEFYASLLAFNAGDLSEEDLTRIASRSRWDRCESSFFIGLTRMAKGDQSGAEAAFKDCVATRCVGFLTWNWSEALLSLSPAKQ